MPPSTAAHAGITSENVAAQYGVSRETQDKFAARRLACFGCLPACYIIIFLHVQLLTTQHLTVPARPAWTARARLNDPRPYLCSPPNPPTPARSHALAAAAQAAGKFRDEIVPVQTVLKDPKTGEFHQPHYCALGLSCPFKLLASWLF